MSNIVGNYTIKDISALDSSILLDNGRAWKYRGKLNDKWSVGDKIQMTRDFMYDKGFHLIKNLRTNEEGHFTQFGLLEASVPGNVTHLLKTIWEDRISLIDKARGIMYFQRHNPINLPRGNVFDSRLGDISLLYWNHYDWRPGDRIALKQDREWYYYENLDTRKQSDSFHSY